MSTESSHHSSQNSVQGVLLFLFFRKTTRVKGIEMSRVHVLIQNFLKFLRRQ